MTGKVSLSLLMLVLCAFSVVVALGLAEGMLRIAGYGDALQFDYQPELGWVNEPRQHARTVGRWSVRINSVGLRGPEYPTPKPAGLFRVLLVGDSFTFGYGVAEDSTYGAQLERLISARGLPCASVQIVNGGVNGYNTEQEVAFVRLIGLSLQPDLVIIGFNPNDIMDAAEGKTMLRHPGLKKVLGRSALYQFMVPRIKSVVMRSAGEAYDSTIARFIAGDSSVSDRGERVRRGIDSLSELGEENGFRIAVALFPFATQVDAPETAHWPPAIFRRLEMTDGIPVLDLLPAFRAAARRGHNLFLDEPTRHPNPSGLRIVATELEHFLASRKLLPDCPANMAGAR